MPSFVDGSLLQPFGISEWRFLALLHLFGQLRMIGPGNSGVQLVSSFYPCRTVRYSAKETEAIMIPSSALDSFTYDKCLVGGRNMAEGVGFEPTVGFSQRSISSRVP